MSWIEKANFALDRPENNMPVICIGIREIGKLNEAEELNKCEINYSWKSFIEFKAGHFQTPTKYWKCALYFKSQMVASNYFDT